MSEPMAAASPRETETAAPEDEPAGRRAVLSSKGLGGVPSCGFSPRMERANSLWLVLPRQTRPARVARTSTRASCAATRSASAGVPWLVTLPALSKRSFHEIGTPSSGEHLMPLAARPCAASASARARAAVSRR